VSRQAQLTVTKTLRTQVANIKKTNKDVFDKIALKTFIFDATINGSI
jgi:hypothetical protein